MNPENDSLVGAFCGTTWGGGAARIITQLIGNNGLG